MLKSCLGRMIGGALLSLALLIGDFSSLHAAPFVATDVQSPTIIRRVDTIAALRLLAGGPGKRAVQVMGYYAVGDGGGGPDRVWDAASVCVDDGAECIDPVASGPGRWTANFNGSHNVLFYGAKGDGINDDYAFIQKALNKTGDIIFPPHKTFIIGLTLTVKSNTRLVGDGHSSIVKLKPATNLTMFKNEGYSAGSDANIVFEGMVIDGNVSNQTNDGTLNKYGIQFKNVSSLKIRKCKIRNIGVDAINMILCYAPEIIENTISYAYNHAVTFQECHGLLAQGNLVYNCGSKTDAYLIPSSGHAFIGVNVANDFVRILGNYVYGMGDSCLRNESGGEGWIISNNIIYGSGKDSIKIMGKTVGGVRYLTVVDATGFIVGGLVTTVPGAEATLNEINGNVLTVTMRGSGTVYRQFSLGDTVTNGAASSKVLKIVSTTMAKVNVVSNNVIIDSGSNGIVANGDAPTVISNNVIRGTGKNLVKGSTSAAGITITDNAAEVLIIGNAITESYAAGISSGDGYSLIIKSNHISKNGTHGIYIGRSTYTSIENNEIFNNSRTALATSAGVKIDHYQGESIALGRFSIKNNRIYDTQGYNQRWGLQLEQGLSTVTDSVIEGNDIWGHTSGPVYTTWSTTLNKFYNNKGFLTENSGTATVASGATQISVTHGLGYTPDVNKVMVTPTNSLGNSAKFWVSNVGFSTFMINVNADPGATTATFNWNIK